MSETPDVINWDHVAPSFKYMARDESDGFVYVYTDKPEVVDDFCWLGGGEYHICIHFSSYRKGTVDWRDSLVERPVT